MGNKDNNSTAIPFVKPARVGNFKLWRSKISVSYSPSDEQREEVRRAFCGKLRAVTQKSEIQVINISTLDGTWKVQIPSTMMMFTTLMQGFAVEDEKMREQFLGSVFGNIYNISTNSSAYLQDSLAFLTEMLTFPYMLLSEKEMVKRMKAVYKETGVDGKTADKQIAEMVGYRKNVYALIEKKKSEYIEEYERQQAERRAKEAEAQKALEQDELAEQAADAVSDKKE